MNSFLTLDLLSTIDRGACRAANSAARPILPRHIVESSVGEYYADNMRQFITTAEDVRQYLLANNPVYDSQYKNISSIVNSLLPIGTAVNGPAISDDRMLADESALLEFMAYPVKNNTPSDYYLDYYLPRLYPDGLGQVTLDRIINRQRIIESAAQSICTGYTPKRDVGRTTEIKNDSGFLTEYLVANLLYPWVMQPINQLRMLIPSINPEVIKRILNINIELDDNNLFMPQALDWPYSLTYECVTDFSAYLDLKMAEVAKPLVIQRQMWTPFFGITHANWYEEHIEDEALRARVFKCFDQSKKLYIEMLKTGLAYEAQYVVLQGFSGRFMISGTLGGLLSLVHYKNTDRYSDSALDIVDDLIEYGYIDIQANPFTREFVRSNPVIKKG